MDLPTEVDKRDVRRPMNAFLIFCKRHRSMVREKNPDLDNRSVTRILGDLWANLQEQEKTVYTDLAKQYKDAFMKANPDYKWHNPEKVQTGQKVVPKPTNMKVIKNEVDLLPEGSIMPGKLADPSDMGGLSLLLMAGQQSLKPKVTENQSRPDKNQSKEGGGGGEKKSPENQSDPGTKTEHVDQSRGAPPGGEHSREKTNGSSLLELAEMCSSEFGADKTKKVADPNGMLKTMKGSFYKSRLAKVLLEASNKGVNSKDVKGDNALGSTDLEKQKGSKGVKKQLTSVDTELRWGKAESSDTVDESTDADAKSDEDDSAILTCGKMVVNHIIDKLFSSTGPTRVSSTLPLNSRSTVSRNGVMECKERNRDGLQEVDNSEGGERENSEKRDIFKSETSEADDAVKFEGGEVKGRMEESCEKKTLREEEIQSFDDYTSEESTDTTSVGSKDEDKLKVTKNRALKKKSISEKKNLLSERKGNGKLNGTRKKSHDNVATQPDEVDGIMSSRKRVLSISSREDDTESDERGDNNQPLRKSRRRNRGQRYQELINEGIIQPSKERMAKLHAQHDESEEEEEFQSIDAHILPETAIRRIRKRTASESDKNKMSALEEAKRYKTGDFDLEAHIATLPACSIDNVGRKRGFMKQRHHSESWKHHDNAFEMGVSMNPQQTVSIPPRVKIPSPEKSQEPVTGSRKRKARKHSITHLLQVPSGGIPACQDPNKMEDKMSVAKPEVTRRRCVSFCGVIEKMDDRDSGPKVFSLSDLPWKSGILLNKENSPSLAAETAESLAKNGGVSPLDSKDATSTVLLQCKDPSGANIAGEEKDRIEKEAFSEKRRENVQDDSVDVKKVENGGSRDSEQSVVKVDHRQTDSASCTKLKQSDLKLCSPSADGQNGVGGSSTELQRDGLVHEVEATLKSTTGCDIDCRAKKYDSAAVVDVKSSRDCQFETNTETVLAHSNEKQAMVAGFDTEQKREDSRATQNADFPQQVGKMGDAIQASREITLDGWVNTANRGHCDSDVTLKNVLSDTVAKDFKDVNYNTEIQAADGMV